MAIPPTRESPTELDELGFLSAVALRLAEERFSEEDVYQLVAEQVASIAPDSLVVTSRFDPAFDSTVVRAYAGPPEILELARHALPDLRGLTFRVNEEARRGISEGRLLRLEGGLRQLVFEAWSVDYAHELEARLGVQSVHVQAFARKGDFLGTTSIISRRSELAHGRLVEAFIRLAAVSIPRIRLEARVRDSEQRLRMLADNSPDVIYRLRLSPTRAFEYVSPAALRVVGVSPRELYDDPCLGETCLYPAEWRGCMPHHVPPDPLIVRCTHRDGSYTWTEQKLTPIVENGELVAVEGIVRDITTRKEAEESLVDADRRKNEFLAVLSHELRNPLSPIRNSLYILERTHSGTEQARRAREVIERQVNHLTRLVDDLLDVTRITRGKIHLQRQPLELNQVVRAVVEDHRSLFLQAGVALDVALAPQELWIQADATRIAQVIGNLLMNAAKFTPRDGRTAVSVTADPLTREAVVRVRDTGVGIDPELLPHVFEPFMQGEVTMERSKGGLGLGLMLAKGLTEMHGGSVAVESGGPGQGAQFTVRLPLQPVGTQTIPRPTTGDGGRARVLVIDDNIDAVETLRDALELGDNTVAVAHTGPEGVAQARAFHPDVILCDIGLPDMDGYAVARAIRDIPELRGVGLVALTGYASAEDIARARDAGFDRHVAKPPTLAQLHRVIAELRTGQHRAADAPT